LWIWAHFLRHYVSQKTGLSALGLAIIRKIYVPLCGGTELSAPIFSPSGQKFRFYQPFGLVISGKIYVPPCGGTKLSLALRQAPRSPAGKQTHIPNVVGILLCYKY
jgi:hypothetical protein